MPDFENNALYIRNEEVKEYLKFLDFLSGCIKVPTIDDNLVLKSNKLPGFTNYEDEYNNGYLVIDPEDEIYIEIKSFVEGSNKIKELLEKERIERLCRNIYSELNSLGSVILKSDQYRDAFFSYKRQINYRQLPLELNNMFATKALFSGTNSPNIVEGKVDQYDRYRVCVYVYKSLGRFFPELVPKEKKGGKVYQLMVLTGFIMSFFKEYGIKNADDFALRLTTGKNTNYRRYLAKTIERYLNAAKNKYDFDYGLNDD